MPLGMSASLINDDVTTVIPNRANAYTTRSRETVAELRGAGLTVHHGDGLIQIRRNAPHYGGSGVMTSMEDWLKWQSDMLTHEILGEAFWDLMVQTRTFGHDKTNDAFGLVHGEWRGHDMLWYEGGDIDASSFMLTFPDDGFAAACFSNDPFGGCADRLRAYLDTNPISVAD